MPNQIHPNYSLMEGIKTSEIDHENAPLSDIKKGKHYMNNLENGIIRLAMSQTS